MLTLDSCFRRVFVAAFLLVFGSPMVGAASSEESQTIDPNNPPQGRFSDEWAEIYMAGGKAGYAHSTMSRDGDVIRTSTEMQMRVGRAGHAVELRLTQGTAEAVGGTPRTFETIMDMSVMKTVTKGTIADGKVKIVSTQYGLDKSDEYAFPTGALMTWGTYRENLLRGFVPGTEYTLRVYAPELRLDDAVQAITRIGEWEPFEHRGKSLRGQKVVVRMETPIGGFEMVTWVDKRGQALKARVPVAGLGDMEIITTDQVTALADFVPREIFMTTAIRVKRPLDPPSIERIRYRLKKTDPALDLASIPTTGMQNSQNVTEDAVDLIVTRQAHRSTSSIDAPLSPGALSEYLQGNLMINTADPELIELAKQAGGEEKEPFALADKLRRFVTEYVKTKSLNVGFATASEVARTKEGDCSEHGILLAALGRLNGIPSRVVAGLAYAPIFGGQSDIFGYHLWTQFYIDGRWIDVDAALRETVCSPTRIALAMSSLKDAGLADLSLPLISKIGGMELEILEIEANSLSRPKEKP